MVICKIKEIKDYCLVLNQRGQASYVKTKQIREIDDKDLNSKHTGYRFLVSDFSFNYGLKLADKKWFLEKLRESDQEQKAEEEVDFVKQRDLMISVFKQEM